MTAFGEPREIEALRKAFRDGATGEPRTAIDAETVYRAVSGALPEPETRRLVDAMADDPDLAEAWALARELVEAERRAERPATVTAIRRRPAARFGGVWTAIAATLALAVGVGVWRQLNPTPTWRGDRPEAPIHLLIDDGQRVPKSTAELRWQATPELEGAIYRVTVTTLDMTPVASSDDLSAPVYSIPRTTLDALPDGTRLLWHVEARTLDGRTLRSQRSSLVLVND